jgi:integrase
VRARLRGINTVRKTLADGTQAVYYYHRITRLRLSGPPGSPEFVMAYADAEKTVGVNNGKTFNGLIRAYTTSIEFEHKLAAGTQREYKRMLTKAEPEFGDMPLAALEDPRVRRDFLDWREKVAKSSGEREADHRLSAISAMWSWAVDRGWLSLNHLKGFKRIYHSDRSDKIWLPEHISAFMDVAPIELQRALIIALHTGQRQGDILRLPWSAYDGSCITLRQSKSNRKGHMGPLVIIPCTSALRRLLDDLPRVSPLVLTTKTGRSFRKRYFADLWEQATLEAKVTGLHFHDLRGTAVTMLSEAGCTPQQIATITGHSLVSVTTILDKYLARTRALAEQAIVNWENSPRTDFANRLQTSTPNSVKGKGKRQDAQ